MKDIHSSKKIKGIAFCIEDFQRALSIVNQTPPAQWKKDQIEYIILTAKKILESTITNGNTQ